MKGKSLAVLLAVACTLVLPGEGARMTKVLHPQELAALNHGASCYFQTKFIADFTRRNITAKVLRNPTPERFKENLSEFAVFYDDIYDNKDINLDMVFNSNVSVMIGKSFQVPAFSTDGAIRKVYSGFTFNQYSLDEQNKHYAYFMDGKYKYSNVKTAVLSCVFPQSWVSSEDEEPKLADGVVVDFFVESTRFEDLAWNSGVYRFFFQVFVGLLFALLSLVCAFGLFQYWRYCDWKEIRALYRTPLACLTINMVTSGTMSFVFFIDGWGSTGFLTVETFSAFITLTRMTTMGSVMMMALHWMRLRSMIDLFTKKRASQRVSSGPLDTIHNNADMGKDKQRNRLLENLHLILYSLAFICIFTDSFSFLYVKLFHTTIDDVWIPLLVFIASLELVSAFFFTQESNLFAREISKLISAKNLRNASNLRFLDQMLRYMRFCSFFLSFSVIVSIAFGVLPLQVNVELWILLWSSAILARLGIGFTIARSSFLNTAGRKRQKRVTPMPSNTGATEPLETIDHL